MGRAKELLEDMTRRGYGAGDLHVCGPCLADAGLSALVQDNAVSNECDFCDRKQAAPFAARLEEVIDYMTERIQEEFTDPANVLPYESQEGGWQGGVFDSWELLEEIGFSPESEDLFEHVAAAFSDQQWCRSDYFALDPSDRLRYGWEAFKDAVKHVRRFTFWSMGDDSGESEHHPDYMPVGGLLAEIGECIRALRLVRPMPKGTPIWRVRVHRADIALEEEHDFTPPPVNRAIQSNRMSPAGVVMFYGADDYETACAETIDQDRADGKRVTGVAFRTARELRLLDLVDLPGVPSIFTQGTSNLRQAIRFLRHFVADLVIPVVRNGREHIEYVPTQAFTEYVRYELSIDGGAPVDGIRYRSAVNGEPCYVLFCTQSQCMDSPANRSTHQQWLIADMRSLRGADAKAMAVEQRKLSPKAPAGRHYP